MQTGALLITGGTGYLGLQLARAWLMEGGEEVVLWVRARTPDDLVHVRTTIGPRLPQAGRILVGGGELGAGHPFEDVDPTPIPAHVHPGAAPRFRTDEANTAGDTR